MNKAVFPPSAQFVTDCLPADLNTNKRKTVYLYCERTVNALFKMNKALTVSFVGT